MGSRRLVTGSGIRVGEQRKKSDGAVSAVVGALDQLIAREQKRQKLKLHKTSDVGI